MSFFDKIYDIAHTDLFKYNAVNIQQILKLTNAMHGSYTYGLTHFTTDHGHNVKIKDTSNTA